MSDNFALQMFIRNQMGNQGGGGAIDTGMSTGAGGNFITQQGGGPLKDVNVLPTASNMQAAALLVAFKVIAFFQGGGGLSIGNFFGQLQTNALLGALTPSAPMPAALFQPSKSKG